MITNLLTHDDISALLLSIKLALVSTTLLLVIATPIAWWLAYSRLRLKVILESIISLPIILPPSVLGFYLLIFFAPHSFLGELWQSVSHSALIFSFPGLVIGSVIYSFPFVVQPLQSTFMASSKRPFMHATQLGGRFSDIFLSVGFPLYYRGYIVASVLGFAHTIGEFGLVLMIGGNIPNKTELVSVDIFNHVEQLEYYQAYTLSIILLLLSFLMLLFVYNLGWKPRWSMRNETR